MFLWHLAVIGSATSSKFIPCVQCGMLLDLIQISDQYNTGDKYFQPENPQSPVSAKPHFYLPTNFIVCATGGRNNPQRRGDEILKFAEIFTHVSSYVCITIKTLVLSDSLWVLYLSVMGILYPISQGYGACLASLGVRLVHPGLRHACFASPSYQICNYYKTPKYCLLFDYFYQI